MRPRALGSAPGSRVDQARKAPFIRPVSLALISNEDVSSFTHMFLQLKNASMFCD